MITNSELKKKWWHRLYKVIFYVLLMIVIAVSIGTISNDEWGFFVGGIIVLFVIDLIHYEGVIYIIYGSGGNSIFRRILKTLVALFGDSNIDNNTNTVLSDKYEVSRERLREERANPYFSSVFLGGEEPEWKQMYAGYIYFRRRDEGIAKKLKKSLDGNIDMKNLEKPINDMDSLNEVQTILKFLDKRFPDKVKENDGDHFHKRLNSEGIILYNENATLKDFMLILVDSFKEVQGLVGDFFDSYVYGEKRKTLIDSSVSDDNSKSDCMKNVKKTRKFLEKEEEKYDLRSKLDVLQVSFKEAYNITLGLEDDSTKQAILKRISIIEILFYGYERIRFFIEGYIKSDKDMLDFLEKNGYDVKKTLSNENSILIADSITCKKVLENIEEAHEIEIKIRNNLI